MKKHLLYLVAIMSVALSFSSCIITTKDGSRDEIRDCNMYYQVKLSNAVLDYCRVYLHYCDRNGYWKEVEIVDDYAYIEDVCSGKNTIGYYMEFEMYSKYYSSSQTRYISVEVIPGFMVSAKDGSDWDTGVKSECIIPANSGSVEKAIHKLNDFFYDKDTYKLYYDRSTREWYQD